MSRLDTVLVNLDRTIATEDPNYFCDYEPKDDTPHFLKGVLPCWNTCCIGDSCVFWSFAGIKALDSVLRTLL
ncbi:hypothetical protein [Vibrio phage vB_VhaP_PG11]|nr:hypothetical protein [Vibrio phage vB_VhaP_PG11]